MAYVVMCESYKHSDPWDIEKDKITLVDKVPTRVFNDYEDAHDHIKHLYNDTKCCHVGWRRGMDCNENHVQFTRHAGLEEMLYIIRYVPEGKWFT